MEIGWIDFSENDREKVLGVLDLLGEPGVVDELGIAPIRDKFSDIFFPGTSTIQTRAKYFFIVPYALKCLESSNKSDLKKELDHIEKHCAEKFLGKNPNEKGVIGKRAINHNKWVKRTPASIYWSGLQRYGILDFKSSGINKNLSVDGYLKLISKHNAEKTSNGSVGNRVDKIEGSRDDEYAFDSCNLNFLKIPFYDSNWYSYVDINLTPEEADFLKKQIISTCEGKMLEHILSNKELCEKVIKCKHFSYLKEIIGEFPEEIQKDYFKALYFSDFVFVLRVIYNDIVSEGKNENAKIWLNGCDLIKISQRVNIDDIIETCEVNDDELEGFLVECKRLMGNDDIDGLKEEIINREIDLKGDNRSKTLHPGEFDDQAWFSGYLLDYRFWNARQIIQDIYDGENNVDGVINNDES